jgi:hypothetical protein
VFREGKSYFLIIFVFCNIDVMFNFFQKYFICQSVNTFSVYAAIDSLQERTFKECFCTCNIVEKEKSVVIGMENELACWGPCSDVWRRYSCMIQSVFLPFGARPL